MYSRRWRTLPPWRRGRRFNPPWPLVGPMSLTDTAGALRASGATGTFSIGTAFTDSLVDSTRLATTTDTIVIGVALTDTAYGVRAATLFGEMPITSTVLVDATTLRATRLFGTT